MSFETNAEQGVQMSLRTGLRSALTAIPTGWFVYGMGEKVAPIRFLGDTHAHQGFWAELQHRRGGLLTKGEGPTLCKAVEAAIKALPLARAAKVHGDGR